MVKYLTSFWTNATRKCLSVTSAGTKMNLASRALQCITSSNYSTHSAKQEGKSRQKLVILGCGWGSYAVLKNINKKLYDVIVVSPRNHFLFTPLLASTTVGTLEFRSIIEPVRNTIFRESTHFTLSHALDLDVEKQEVTCQSVLNPQSTYKLSYDKLVIGVGALSNTLGVPGVEEHAFFLKELWDARSIRDRILGNFELAVQPGVSEAEAQRLLHTVIVGGGPTGVEFGAELYDFVESDVARIFKNEKENVKVTLIESNKILSSFDKRLQTFAEKKIAARKRFTLLQSAVTEVCSTGVTLQDGQVLPCGLVVWSTGLAPRIFTKTVHLPKNERGQLLTDRHLQVNGTPRDSVFALGDCADIQDYSLPCTAQVAEKQGLYLANMLNSSKTCKDHPQFKFTSAGMLAYIGGYEGLTDLPDVKLRGFSSWFLWRSAYLTRLGSWRLRMQVPMDWFKTLLFGRDTSRF